MNYTHHFSPQFEQDLWEIEYNLYQIEGAARCDKVITSIYEKIAYIVLQPLHFPIHIISFKSGSFCKAVHFNTYLIMFEITDQHIEFVAIYHGKRNI